MTRERWGDRVATRRCGLCGTSGFDVVPGLACWRDSGCVSMDRCKTDRERCRRIHEEHGGRWPDGLEQEAPSRPLPGFESEAPTEALPGFEA